MDPAEDISARGTRRIPPSRSPAGTRSRPFDPRTNRVGKHPGGHLHLGGTNGPAGEFRRGAFPNYRGPRSQRSRQRDPIRRVDIHGILFRAPADDGARHGELPEMGSEHVRDLAGSDQRQRLHHAPSRHEPVRTPTQLERQQPVEQGHHRMRVRLQRVEPMRRLLVGLSQQRRILSPLSHRQLEQLLQRPNNRLQQQPHDARAIIPRLPSLPRRLQPDSQRISLLGPSGRTDGPDDGVSEQPGRVHVEHAERLLGVCGAVV